MILESRRRTKEKSRLLEKIKKDKSMKNYNFSVVLSTNIDADKIA